MTKKTATSNKSFKVRKLLEMSTLIPLITLFISILALIYTIYEGNVDKKNLKVTQLSDTYLVDENTKKLNSDIQIFYKDEAVNALRSVLVKIENNGNITIRPEDFEKEAILSFQFGTEIVDAKIASTNPYSINTNLEIRDNKLSIPPLLLNKGEFFVIEILLIEKIPLPLYPYINPFSSQKYALDEVEIRIADTEKIELSHVTDEDKKSNWEKPIWIVLSGLIGLSFGAIIASTDKKEKKDIHSN